MMNHRFAWWHLLVCSLGMALLSGVASAIEPLSAGDGPVEVRGDQLDYDKDSGLVTAKGNVVIQRGGEELRADYVELNTDTEKARAVGNVTLKRGVETWNFEELEYNFSNKTARVTNIEGAADPFRVQADETLMTGSFYILHNAKVTTCENEYPDVHWHLWAKKITVLPGRYMKARGAVWYFGNVPSLYVPFWYRDLRGGYGFHLRPGYRSRMGAFLLSSYYYPISPWLKGETHLDGRTKRGFAVGQDIGWHDAEHQRWVGDIQTYYAADQEPVDSDEDAATADIGKNRWRVLARHQYNMTPDDYFLLQGQWLSDTDILEDFFEKEFRRSSQPDNYAVYTHRADSFAAGVLFRKRLNDFYSRVERLPELSLSVLRQEVAESGFYYESQNTATYLQQVWPESAGLTDYSIFRVDSSHMAYYPLKTFGFLNMVPRAGYRATHYSKTLDSAGAETGAKFRSRFELGQEVSFKAFKQWDQNGTPMRHIVEPYVNYTYVPEPNVSPDELYQFDHIDGFAKQHTAHIGVRNKIQVKKEKRPFDLLDIDVSTVLNIETADGEDALEWLVMDAELRPHRRVRIDLDGTFDIPDGELDTFNTQVGYRRSDQFLMELEHRYRRETSSLLAADCTFFPGRPWAFTAFGRYEMEDTRLEEVGGYVQRNLDCLAIRSGLSTLPGYTRSDGSERDDEWYVSLEIWLTAFPSSRIGGRMRN